MQGYKQKKAFIVAQSPMENTVRDFLKMMVDRKCGVVVMLTTEAEKVCTFECAGVWFIISTYPTLLQNACYQYWHSSDTMQFKDVSVKVGGQVQHTGYTERIINITLEVCVCLYGNYCCTIITHIIIINDC